MSLQTPLRVSVSIFIVACLIVPAFLCLNGDARAETFVFDGTAGSHVHITETTTIRAKNINPASVSNGSKLVFNASYPTSSHVGGYAASFSNVQFAPSPAPSYVSSDMTDQFGNKYRQFVWNIDKSGGTVFTATVTTQFDADLEGDLRPLSYDDPIGTSALPEFRSPTAMVQSADPAIVNKKDLLLAGATSEAEAVDRIINFVRTNIPQQDSGMAKDAVSSLNNHKGNCVNRAHLALALLRSAGIPARCVSGLLYDDEYTVSYPYHDGSASTSITWGSGSHVWIEVYYPDENAWVAYDPWMDKGFVDSRHVRLASGKDFDSKDPSTRGNAGMISVTGLNPGVSINPEVSIASSDLRDSLSLNYRYTEYSPAGQFMIGRTMQSSRAPTPTPTPSPTIKPNNTTATPKPPTPTPPGGTPTGGSPSGDDIPRYNLTGSVIDHDTGTPVPGATVMLDSIQLSASSSGKFVFLNALSGGMYNLTVSAPGYETDMRAIVPNGADMDVTIILRPIKTSAPFLPGNPLPGPGALAIVAALAGGALLRGKRKP